MVVVVVVVWCAGGRLAPARPRASLWGGLAAALIAPSESTEAQSCLCWNRSAVAPRLTPGRP